MESIRRIVTEVAADGMSRIAQDGPSPAERLVPERPGYRVTNLWRTGPAPDITAPDSIEAHRGVLPPSGGTVLRIIDWPPESSDPQELARVLNATFAQIYPDADHRPVGKDHPGMHTTRTVDYALVMSGEITAIVGNEETVMRAGDVLIQRGTSHAWANRSGKPVRVAFVLIDAEGKA